MLLIPLDDMIMGVKGVFTLAVVAAFVSGAFVASPELRAYAANTVGSADIINNSILSEDIKDSEVKTADIATGAVQNSDIGTNAVTALKIQEDAVGASEIKGVTKLIFAECSQVYNFNVNPGLGARFNCNVAGAAVGDKVIVTNNSPESANHSCFAVTEATVAGNDLVYVTIRNVCDVTRYLSTIPFAIIVYD